MPRAHSAIPLAGSHAAIGFRSQFSASRRLLSCTNAEQEGCTNVVNGVGGQCTCTVDCHGSCGTATQASTAGQCTPAGSVADCGECMTSDQCATGYRCCPRLKKCIWDTTCSGCTAAPNSACSAGIASRVMAALQQWWQRCSSGGSAPEGSDKAG